MLSEEAQEIWRLLEQEIAIIDIVKKAFFDISEHGFNNFNTFVPVKAHQELLRIQEELVKKQQANPEYESLQINLDHIADYLEKLTILLEWCQNPQVWSDNVSAMEKLIELKKRSTADNSFLLQTAKSLKADVLCDYVILNNSELRKNVTAWELLVLLKRHPHNQSLINEVFEKILAEEKQALAGDKTGVISTSSSIDLIKELAALLTRDRQEQSLSKAGYSKQEIAYKLQDVKIPSIKRDYLKRKLQEFIAQREEDKREYKIKVLGFSSIFGVHWDYSRTEELRAAKEFLLLLDKEKISIAEWNAISIKDRSVLKQGELKKILNLVNDVLMGEFDYIGDVDDYRINQRGLR